MGAEVSGGLTRVALIGASGHGLSHRRNIARLEREGQLRLVALVDVRPVEAAPDAPIPEHVRVFTDHREMLREVRPDVVVICAPPHTHLALADDVLRSGADALLEKPPVLSLAEHRALTDTVHQTGRACQVGFQALGSVALSELSNAIRDGRLGAVTGISTIASWRRDDAYYQRSPWAGRRTVDGRPSLDGAIANPLAHALMDAVALAGVALGAATPAGVPGAAGTAYQTAVTPTLLELERYRTRPIEVDDTASLRVTSAAGPPVVMAVTLCGEDKINGEVIVHGTTGKAVLEYPTDRLRLPGEAELRQVPGRVDLLENLLAHRTAPERVPLLVPLERTAPFTAILEAVQRAPEPILLDGAVVESIGTPPSRVQVITGINAALREAADRLLLLSEVGVPWAEKPYQSAIHAPIASAPENAWQTEERVVR